MLRGRVQAAEMCREEARRRDTGYRSEPSAISSMQGVC